MAFDMAGRLTSPEEMPPLEPLSEANSQYEFPSVSPPSPPLSRTSPRPVAQSVSKQQPDREMGHLMTDLTGPLMKFSLVLENKGNVARDHLASERTYLAYVRTSLATASAGVALVQLFTLAPQGGAIDLTKFAKPLGATIVLFGLVILVLGVIRYFTTQSALVRGYFPVARNSITAIAFFLGSLVGIVFGVILAGTRS
ncbi:hypothetical protein OG21DRAFT_1517787 [Imleria badia]|nr:hypothetical protein OG21DRAFT_1517787 [Imleria badia]